MTYFQGRDMLVSGRVKPRVDNRNQTLQDGSYRPSNKSSESHKSENLNFHWAKFPNTQITVNFHEGEKCCSLILIILFATHTIPLGFTLLRCEWKNREPKIFSQMVVMNPMGSNPQKKTQKTNPNPGFLCCALRDVPIYPSFFITNP